LPRRPSRDRRSRRGADADKREIRAGDRIIIHPREEPLAGMPLEERIEPPLVDRSASGVDRRRLPRIDLDDVDGVLELGEAGPRDQADVAPADDSYPHLPVILRFVTSELGFGMVKDIRLERGLCRIFKGA